MVFTVPKRLRIFFRFDRKLLGELPVDEIDPLLCPDCGATPYTAGGTAMRIAVPPVVLGVAFPIDFASLRRLLAHLGFAPQQPEPLAQAPPDEAEAYAAHA